MAVNENWKAIYLSSQVSFENRCRHSLKLTSLLALHIGARWWMPLVGRISEVLLDRISMSLEDLEVTEVYILLADLARLGRSHKTWVAIGMPFSYPGPFPRSIVFGETYSCLNNIISATVHVQRSCNSVQVLCS
jgi:hypothetical protein